MISSLSGSNLIFRPVSMAIPPRSPTLMDRCPTSAGQMVFLRLKMQSMKFRLCPPLL